MPLIQPLLPAWTYTSSPDLSLHLDMHTGMAEVCYCPVSLVYFQLLLLETLPPSLSSSTQQSTSQKPKATTTYISSRLLKCLTNLAPADHVTLASHHVTFVGLL